MNAANNAVELPSLEEVEEMDRQQQKAIESLEISSSITTTDDDGKKQQ